MLSGDTGLESRLFLRGNGQGDFCKSGAQVPGKARPTRKRFIDQSADASR